MLIQKRAETHWRIIILNPEILIHPKSGHELVQISTGLVIRKLKSRPLDPVFLFLKWLPAIQKLDIDFFYIC